MLLTFRGRKPIDVGLASDGPRAASIAICGLLLN
jgi:hypothetical protein